MTGDQADIAGRIKAVLPRWFGPASPLLDALLQGLANGAAFVYTLYLYAKLQTRILTASEGWLDMIAADFFGTNVLRAANQSDASYRAAIIANMFRERATRNAITLVLTALTGRAPVIVEPQRPADTGVYGASVQVSQPGVTSYINSLTGLVAYATPNTPRYQSGQLLIEAAATNVITHSEQFNDASWVKINCSVTPNVTIAPDGNLTADKLVEDGTNAQHYVAQTQVLTGNSSGYVFAKAAERTKMYVTSLGRVPTDGAGQQIAYFDLIAGTVVDGVASPPSGCTITPVGNGWYMCALGTLTSASAQREIRLSATPANQIQSYQGDGVSGIYLWGGQLTAGGLTSYIPTAAAVTRAADTLLNAGSGAGGAGYGKGGAYGSMLLPYQAFVTAFRPLASGVPNVAGYGISSAGYGVASQGEYVSINSVTGAVQDADINSAIDLVKPAGTTIWARISS